MIRCCLSTIPKNYGNKVIRDEGSSSNTDFNLGAVLVGSNGFGGAGGYTSTPQGKVVTAAFTDAYNNIDVSDVPARMRALDGINQLVVDVETGRTEITSHNHGFAVDAPIGVVSESPAGFGRVEVSHVNLNDNVVEGLRALDIPAFSVQYHPESAAGPHDANYLFDRFRDLVLATQKDAHA